MSTYTQQYTRPYLGGYVDRPDESTPEYAQYINARDDALIRIEAFLAALNIPSKLSELVNDKGFIDATVSNLANYYLKTETYARTETYTQTEVQALIADAVSKVSGKLNISVVDALPTSDISTTTFYLVPKETAQEKNLYDEYINTDGTESGWELIGAVSTSVDLSEYYKKAEVDTLLANKVNTSDLVASSFSGTKVVIGNQVSDIKSPFKFGIDENGNYGYYKVGADTVTPFKSGGSDFDFLIPVYKNGIWYNVDGISVEQKYEVTENEDSMTLNTTASGIVLNNNTGGSISIVVVLKEPVTSIKMQYGYATQNATLPGIVMSGAGRVGFLASPSYKILEHYEIPNTYRAFVAREVGNAVIEIVGIYIAIN